MQERKFFKFMPLVEQMRKEQAREIRTYYPGAKKAQK